MTEPMDPTADFVDHIHVYTGPGDRLMVQHERNEGQGADPRRAITLLVRAAQYVAAAHNIPLEEG